jgi:hypothetical protein
MASDQNEIESFKIETIIRVNAEAEFMQVPHSSSAYSVASQLSAKWNTRKWRHTKQI